jgi:hypothetical protein
MQACYAETFAERFRGVPEHPYADGFDPRLIPKKLLEPLRWGSARTVFVNSMSDLSQDPIPDRYIEAVTFSGPGQYADGTPSIPLLALEHAVNTPSLCEHLQTCPSVGPAISWAKDCSRATAFSGNSSESSYSRPSAMIGLRRHTAM